jgi:tetratricopeptide (TPR) repeat protein
VLALQCAIHHTPKATQALYLLGTFWYAQCQYEAAILCWERARALDPTLPAVHRQLALAYMNQRHDSEAALTAYETAFACDITNACLFFELDQLYKLTNVPPQERLINLELHDTLVTQRADLSLERINLLNLLCRHDEAADLLLARPFPAWAGSERKARGQYVLALVEQAKTLLREGKATAALSYLHQARHDSEPFGKSPLSGVEEHQIFYCLGCAYTALGEYGQAEHYYYQVVSGANPPRSAFGYHEQPPEMLFYQALARRKLGDHTAAELILQQLIDYGDSHLEDTIQIDYFAVALPARALFDIDLNQRNRVHCLFMSGLGCLGLGMTAEAIEQFNAVLALRADHQGAALHKRMVTSAHVFA